MADEPEYILWGGGRRGRRCPPTSIKSQSEYVSNGIEEITPVTDEMYQRMLGMLNMPPAPGKVVTIQVPDVPPIAGPDEQVRDE